MSTVPQIDVLSYINGHKLSRFQLLIVVLCFLVVAVDGFDTAAVGYIAPALRTEWGLTPAQLAPLFASGLLGLMVGALIFGPIADKVGRKPILIFTTIFFGVATLLSATSDDIHWLTFWRLLTGIGLGGAMPTATTLTAEYCPERVRSTMITAMFCGFTLGGALGGLAAAGLIENYGWEAVLVLGGVLPLILLIFLIWLLPESPRYLALKGGADQRIAELLSRIHPSADLLAAKFKQPISLLGSPVRNLFSPDLIRGTILIWMTFFMSLLVFYLLTSWLPTLLITSGLNIRTASLVGLLLPLGSTVGALCIGYAMDKLDAHSVLAVSYVIGAVSIAVMGYTAPIRELLMIVVFGAGIGTGGAMIGVNALAASFYPTANRATGVSWANGVGRSGSILGSIIGGYLLHLDLSLTVVFLVAAVPALFAAITIFAKHRRIVKVPASLKPRQGH